jgi:uncharacterized alpha-E superfamily protein
MISRVADHCFWLGRYLERAESTSRVLNVTRSLALDGDLGPRQCWQPLITVCGEQAPFAARFGDGAGSDGEVVQEYITWDERNPVSIRRSVQAARENARSIRDVITLEVWESTNELHLWLASREARAQYRDHRYEFYRHIRREVQLGLGLLRSTMLRDLPLDFIWLGVLLERLGQTARILDMHHQVRMMLEPGQAHQEHETALWLSLLRACSGFEPFMKTYQGRVTAQAVAAFLLLEGRFPRSVRYCAQVAWERLSAIRSPQEKGLPGGGALERLRALDVFLSEQQPAAVDPSAIHPLLSHVVKESQAVCELLGRELLGG